MDSEHNKNDAFIHDAYTLLKKLEDKDLWDKDTLVIGLDKSVRKIAYTLRKLSHETGVEPPPIRFFNYSSRDGDVSNKLKKIKNALNKLKHPYSKILILDDYIHSGRSVSSLAKIIKEHYSSLKKKPTINYASTTINPSSTYMIASAHYDKFPELDEGKYLEMWGNDEYTDADREDSFNKRRDTMEKMYADPSILGIIHLKKTGNGYTSTSDITGIENSHDNPIYAQRIRNKKIYKKFIQNRLKLSKDIKKYLKAKHIEKPARNPKTLERLISAIFLFSFIIGSIFSLNNLTGNIVGASKNVPNAFGLVLIVFGILGFLIYRKYVISA